MLPVVGQPVGGKLSLVGPGILFGGVHLLLPVRHGLAVSSQAFNVP